MAILFKPAGALLALLLAGAVPQLQAADHSHHQHHQHQQQTGKLVLDNGKQWPTDQVLRDGMAQLRQLLAAQLPAIRNGSLDKAASARLGQQVEQQLGQVVAKCGNSGNSTVPHLHFQLSDGPLVSHAASLPAYFSGVHKDGVRQELVLPLSGDRLTQPAPKAPAAISSAPAAGGHASEDPQGN